MNIQQLEQKLQKTVKQRKILEWVLTGVAGAIIVYTAIAMFFYEKSPLLGVIGGPACILIVAIMVTVWAVLTKREHKIQRMIDGDEPVMDADDSATVADSPSEGQLPQE